MNNHSEFMKLYCWLVEHNPTPEDYALAMEAFDAGDEEKLALIKENIVLLSMGWQDYIRAIDSAEAAAQDLLEAVQDEIQGLLDIDYALEEGEALLDREAADSWMKEGEEWKDEIDPEQGEGWKQ